MPDESDYLLISGIQHFAFCRRQWALIHIESAWKENYFTASGALVHTRAHNASLSEKRGDLIVARAMPVVSHTLGIRGVCDVIEFRRDSGGVALFGREGLWIPFPVEYKRGRPKTHDADRLQLCAQAICLEEMLACPPISDGFLYYDEIKRREEVPLTEELRASVSDAFAEMRGYYERRHTPKAKKTKSCAACSVRDFCMPELPVKGGVAEYISSALNDR